jgi:Rod binding domain-containing protein
MGSDINVSSPDLAGLIQAPPITAALGAGALSGPASLQPGSAKSATQGGAEKAAKGFESVFLNTLLNEMGKTVEDSGLLGGSAMQQTQGIFWYYLSQTIADKGGVGLWKDLVRHLPSGDAKAGAKAAAQTPAQTAGQTEGGQ